MGKKRNRGSQGILVAILYGVGAELRISGRIAALGIDSCAMTGRRSVENRILSLSLSLSLSLVVVDYDYDNDNDYDNRSGGALLSTNK